MQVIIVDDNEKFANGLRSFWGRQVVRVRLSGEARQSPWHAAREVSKVAKGDDVIVLINVNLKCKDNNRQDQAGVEVLKYLRLTKDFDDRARKAHCVLYSFQCVEQLLRRKPSSLIICSDGVTFQQLPCDFSELALQELAEEKAQIENQGLDRFLRGEFTLPDERHSWANWWAARQMFITYFNERERSDYDLSDFINLEIENQQLRNALYLYDQSEQLRALMEGDEQQRAENLFNEIKRNLGSQKVGLVDDEAQRVGPSMKLGWCHIYSLVLRRDIDSVTDLIADLRIDLDNLKVEDLKGTFQEANLENYACVLLDLRLRDESPNTSPVSRFSGAIILKALRKVEPTLPVIITTASNKASTYEELMRLGADAYWVKQGIDERRKSEETLANYFKFMELVCTATNSKYRFLRRFGRAVKGLREKPSRHWWEAIEWFDHYESRRVTTQAREDQVFRILHDALIMLRSYLHQYEMGYGHEIESYNGTTLEEFSLWSVIQHLGKAIEEVHRWDQIENRPSSGIIGGYYSHKEGAFVVRRGDWYGYRMYDVRSDASHLPSASDIDWDDLQRFVANLLCYLEYGPQEEFEKLRQSQNRIPSLERMRDSNELYDSRFLQILEGT